MIHNSACGLPGILNFFNSYIILSTATDPMVFEICLTVQQFINKKTLCERQTKEKGGMIAIRKTIN